MPTTVNLPEKLPETRGKGDAGGEDSTSASNDHPKSMTEPPDPVMAKPKPVGKKDKRDGSGNKRNKKAKKDAPRPLTKVIIRRLPPSMDEETFRKQIEPMPDHDDFYFVSGDWSLGRNASSRAYINFTRAEDIYLFKDKFDGYIFVDSKGVEYPAVVEFAPFQELPRNRSRKKDVKCGTIETDTHFLAFKEALEAEEKDTAGKSKSKLEYTYKIKDEEKITSTPLLEYIAQKRQEKRDEKRKKNEEKKKQRKEERQKKSGKAVPEVIKEERTKDEDILVRTVPSRLDPNQGKKDFGKKGNEKVEVGKDAKEKDKKQRNRKEKDKERVKQDKEEGGEKEPEKVLSRKQERDRLRKEKEKARKQEEREKKASGEASKKEKETKQENKQESQSQKPTPADVPKKEVKKYSERRKETRARAETRLAELEDKDRKDAATGDEFKSITVPKIDIKKSILTPHVAPFIPKEKSTIILGESSFTLPPAFPQKSSPAIQSQQPKEDLPLLPAKKEPTPTPETAAPDSSSSERKVDIDEKLKEAREARKIRNKDRPSLEIYQPRKRLMSNGAPAAAGSKESANKSEDDNKAKEKSDSDRSGSDKSTAAKPASHGGAKEKDKRHKLTKKASDKERPKDRRARRKNSSEAEKECDSRKTSREEPPPPAEPVPTTPTAEEKPTQKATVTEVVEALEGVKLDS